jgi:hypothetical protein
MGFRHANPVASAQGFLAVPRAADLIGIVLIAFYRSDTAIYFLADRLQDDHRFYVFDERAGVGLERTLGRGFALKATVSYIFDCQLFQGPYLLSDRTDFVAFDPGLGLSLQLLWRR